MTGSSRHVDVVTVALEGYDLEPDDVLDGTPATAELTVTALGGVEVGIWEITPGTVKDVEKDEAFVVVAGEGSITFASGEVVDISPGSLVRLHAGEETVWVIRSTIRKVYVV